MTIKTNNILIALLTIAIAATSLLADPLPGRDVLKFSQRPMDQMITPDGTVYWGHDELSFIEGDHSTGIYGSATGIYPPGVFMADDFADNFDTDVVHVKWWGSYPNNDYTGVAGVQRFLIAFETDVPADPGNTPPFSYPGTPILSQVVDRGPLAVQSGTFTETPVGGAATERLFEYNAELKVPFAQQADTVYWLKIVALIDPSLDGTDLQWGWHNRDYTIKNPLASPIPTPGEHDQGPGPFTDPTMEIWHFQDDAVTGGIDYVDLGPNPPIASGVSFDQGLSTFRETYYVDNLDGPVGINNFSKDLAFELYTVPEPAMMGLLALGGLAVLRRRKSQTR
ncbi:hypothetical protein LCGC14_0274590 [marine sediment metagenome]|uniref:Uncharacterized protein n=1 Tax=marine sediment metagenome TaxID=412755 RepID=A0A0F9WIQ9_9ZZZZ|nr:PEP-CTERM sorting domain-containing protein [Phycisphaerae bacterium]HDZ43401.1 PEP-CTERM sorting domain-containing protein [Phycisphaerae bacterium]